MNDQQIIKLSDGCPYKCPFCFNGRTEFLESKIKEGRKRMKGKRGNEYLEQRCC